MLRCAMHHGKDNKDCCSFHTIWRRSSSLCVWRPNYGRPFWGKNILAIVGLNYIFHNYRYNSVFAHYLHLIRLSVLVRGVTNKHAAINFDISRQGPGDG